MLRIALLMLLGDRAKYLGLVFGIAFATLLMAQQVSIFCGILLRTSGQIFDVTDADIWVMDSKMRYIDEVEPMPDTALNRVRSVDGVEWAVPLYKGLAVARSPDGLLQQVILMGLDDTTMVGAPRQILLGNLEDLRKPDAMIMDRAGYTFIWPGEEFRLGKELELNDKRAVIVGICNITPPFLTFPVVYTRYSQALQYVSQGRKQLSFVLAKPKPGLSAELVAQRIRDQTKLQAVTWTQFSWQIIGYYLKRTGIPINFGITVTLGFIVGAAIAGQTFYIFMMENLRQFGALKAIGVHNKGLLSMVLLQALIVAVIGYSIGIGFTSIFFFATRNIDALRGFFLPWQVMIGVGITVMIIVFIASLFSVRKLMKLDPAIVFRG